MMEMLEVEGLHAAYQTARVLHGVTLSVRAGEVIAVLGRNGMGKTTMLRSICGLRPPSVTAGSITFDGRDIVGAPAHEISRRGLGLVPQGRRIFASLTVQENLTMAARPASGGWTLERVYELFPQLGGRPRQLGGTLSGGEQQMLAIGRALMTNPRLLVMDEPSEGLAPSIRDVILDRLRLLGSSGQAVLLAEQNVDLALEVAERIAVLGESGTVEWSGPPELLRADAALLRSLIGL